MPYLLLKTLISLHCGNPSKNLSSKVSYFELLKSIFNLCLRSQEGGRNSAITQKKRWAILWARVVSVAA
ncbi:hypothetical protein FD724_35775 (plasmid) [Nostoc sp. C057]|uniref:hypothetical protein n=1 Tax=Nostoc sp. C057 TaxID=2576903 RepID=UPI0015C34B81|nr:hypothetical protein [Nostoc sp. C057]QLE53277.1 hypothetical protein FD724_35775 [Nostoc sp. C057]